MSASTTGSNRRRHDMSGRGVADDDPVTEHERCHLRNVIEHGCTAAHPRYGTANRRLLVTRTRQSRTVPPDTPRRGDHNRSSGSFIAPKSTANSPESKP